MCIIIQGFAKIPYSLAQTLFAGKAVTVPNLFDDLPAANDFWRTALEQAQDLPVFFLQNGFAPVDQDRSVLITKYRRSSGT